MNQSTKISLIVGGVLVVLAGVIGITFAYFSTGGVQDTANTFNSGCLNISLTNESTSINLTDAYPITDVEGLETTSYDFTVKNNCNSATNYQINLESLNEQVNSLNADYIKVSLSSDTVDNVISILGDNKSVTPSIDGSYESYNLYTDSLDAKEEKTYHLNIWVDYDATVEQAASKTYTSKINVIANPETTVVDTLEAKFNIEGTTATATLTENVTSATYCTTTGNICTPSTSATISNNTYEVELERNENKQIVCTQLNGTSKVICSNGVEIAIPTASDAILAGKDILTRDDFSTTVTEETTGIIYQTTDWKGTSYYFAGAPTDNWVRFGGFYWRIVRVNGDGSVRLIYNGTSTTTTGTGTMINNGANQKFNSSSDRSEYVGLKYTEGSQHGQTTDSPILNTLQSWYTSSNLDDYADYIDTSVGFCSDRNMASGSSWSSQPSSTIYYAARERLYTNKSPSLACTTSDIITEPVGLITADEVSFAGGVLGTNNTSYYLYNNQYYWTMSPYNFDGSYAVVFAVISDGSLGNGFVNIAWGVRPVINLKANTKFQGSGTTSDPYVVVS